MQKLHDARLDPKHKMNETLRNSGKNKKNYFIMSYLKAMFSKPRQSGVFALHCIISYRPDKLI